MAKRFTIDGSVQLERRLDEICRAVCAAVESLFPPGRIEALVLGGGYGRGEGGVMRTPQGDQPYNDLEFYLFLRGNRLWNEHKHRGVLKRVADTLEPEAGLHIEFKVDSFARWRSMPVTMYSYDLAAGHKTLLGDASALTRCEQHLDPCGIPLAEGTRLLLNRCSGLLLVHDLLRRPALSDEDADFIGRNLEKTKLALGDAVLTAHRRYHWSCVERGERLKRLPWASDFINSKDIPAFHACGVDFKLHPRRVKKSTEVFRAECAQLVGAAQTTWLWLESVRLGRRFRSFEEYAWSGLEKCPGTSLWRNYLLNLKTFGLKAALDPWAWRYPRERLLAALPLLLDGAQVGSSPLLRRRLQRTLLSPSTEWEGLLTAYKNIWPAFG